jgi:hypothetical protein
MARDEPSEANEARTLLHRGLARTHALVTEYRSKLAAARDELDRQRDEAMRAAAEAGSKH